MKSLNCLKFLLATLFAVASTTTLSAQRNVTGHITDSNKIPMIGVTVIESGTSNGTVTDADGFYSITIRNSSTTLEASYMGYDDLIVNVDKRTEIDMVMTESAQNIEDIVVVGYGTQKKVNVTGAISSIGQETLKDRGATSNVVASLQGAMPGVVVTRSTPAIGREGWEVKIRGEASVNAVDALVLVDGVQGSLDGLNEADIENISVLKDASASIYGARAAGGVILVTTRRGQEGKLSVSYKGSFEISQPSLQVEYLNASQYAYIFEEGVINDNSPAFFQAAKDKYGNVLTGINTGSVYKSTLAYGLIQEMKKGSAGQYAGTVQPYNYGGRDIGFFDYDINDVLWQNALSQSHNITVSGGTKQNRYSLSLGYRLQNSMLKIYDEEAERYNLRINNDYTLNRYISVGANLAYERSNTDYATYSANSINGLPVGSPYETQSGQPYSWGSNTSGYGLAKWGGSTTDFNNRLTVSLNPVITLSKDLQIVTRASLRNIETRNNVVQNKITWYRYDDTLSNDGKVVSPTTDMVTKKSQNVVRQEYQAYLDYKHTFANAHNVSVMAGLSYENYRSDSFTATGDNLSTGVIHSLNTAALADVSDSVIERALASYYARFNYNFKGKYLIELLGRYDGSSRFTRGHRWAPFGGVSLGWRLSEEEWLKSTEIFSNLKLRASWGETGNEAGLASYPYAEVVQVSNTSPLFGNSYSNTLAYGSMVSYTRTWERVTNSNIGLDFGLFNGRLNGTFELFKRVNDDMLVAVTYPETLGATAPKTNSGQLDVTGWEISISWRDRIGDMEYWFGGNLSDSKTCLVEMEGKQVKTWKGVTTYLEGYSLNTIWGLDAMKLIETEEELAAYAPKVGADVYGGANMLQCGDVMYRDVDGDGKVTKDDVILLGDTTPHYSFSFNFGFNYRNFDFSVMLQGVGKQSILRNVNSATCLGYSWYQASSNAYYDNHWTTVGEACAAVGDNRSTLAVNRNPNAAPRIAYLVGKNYNYLTSSAWWSVQNGAYIRLKNIVVGYTLPQNITQKIGLQRVRIYFSGNDLLTMCGIKDGYDPENRSISNGGQTSATGYPFAKSYVGGIDITF